METLREPTLLLRGGHVIDPDGHLDGIADVVVAGDRISRVVVGGGMVEEECPPTVVDCSGRYVCPGLVDLHGHYYEGSRYGVDPRAALRGGVTTAVDAGTCGCVNFPEFRRTAIDGGAVRILPFIHIGCLGIPTPSLGELLDLRHARPRETAATILEHRDIALGVKFRAGTMALGHNVEAVELALRAAAESGSRMMVHISVQGATREVLPRLRPGDIVTHCFTGRGDGILDAASGALLPETRAARDRGVVFDIGHGSGSFRWDTALKAFEHTFYPDTISTDLHRYNVEQVVFDLPTTMSKFLLLGMTLREVVEKATLAPAQAIGRAPELGTLQSGASADVLVFSVEEGEFRFQDSHLQERIGERRLQPELVVCRGRLVRPSEVPVRLRRMTPWDEETYAKLSETSASAGNY
jgi:dihydroorotase